MKFIVKREHFGAKMYMTGDTREADERDVKHLIDKGVLVKDGPVDLREDGPMVAEQTAESVAAPIEKTTPARKAEKSAPKNKAEKAPKNKSAG